MVNKEVRDILLRRIVRVDEQFWAAAPSNTKFHFHGVRDGAGDVRMFGVMHMIRSYRIMEMEADEALDEAEIALNSMGKPIWLASMPEAKGVLYTPGWIAPVLLTIEQDGEGLQMTAYTGRSLLAGHFRCRIAMWILEQRLPDGLICIGNKKPDKKEAKAKAAKEKEAKKKQKASKETGKGSESPKKKKAASKRPKK